jgi:hypothetical protein
MPKVQRSPLANKAHSASEPNIDNIEPINMDQLGDYTPPNYVQQRQKRGREREFEDELSDFKKEIKNMISSLFAAQQAELKIITTTQLEIKQTNTNIESSIAFLAAQNEDLRKKMEQLEIQTRKDRDHIIILEDQIEDLQREHRKKNFEIKNMPKLPAESKEDLTNMVVYLSKTLNCNIKKEDVKDIYRVKLKKDAKKSNMPIVVELSSTIQKTDIIKSTKVFNIKHHEKLRAKHLGATKDEDTAVFISEQLTARGARLHFVARDLAKSKDYKFCWTAYGRVYLRKNENSPVILVRNETQVHNLMLA